MNNISRLILAVFFLATPHIVRAAKPNVILVITDDQGYGDVGAHGNSMIRTPNIDKLHSQSVRLSNFHVDPTCSPSRSALMTGRYSTRTGVWHTIMGRSLMHGRELTIAEVFRSAGYRTGMYGKWHLGDNAPCRPQDQGFDESFYNGGGGVTQTPDYFGNDYFDDTYFRGGVPEKTTGYCTDVWFDNALAFIEKQSTARKPFFAYITTNAPHGPFFVDPKYSKPYEALGVGKTMAAFYGMITNIDENMGRLTRKLDELKISENTILIFMTDNGTAAGVSRRKPRKRRGRNENESESITWRGFNAGMRGQKGSEYEGGHRVPCFIRWPGGKIYGGRDIPQLSAHIDILPTLAELCGIEKPAGPAIDGMSLVPLLRGLRKAWPERTLLVHSQRLETPVKWRKVAVMTQRYRYVNGKELYNIQDDPGQQKDIANDHPLIISKLRTEYETWWKSLEPEFSDYVRIDIGSAKESPSQLTCHDWHTGGGPVPWNQGMIRRGTIANGYWAIDVKYAGSYEVKLFRWPSHLGKSIEAVKARIECGNTRAARATSSDDTAAVFQLDLQAGKQKLQTWLTLDNGKERGAYFVEVRKIEN